MHLLNNIWLSSNVVDDYQWRVHVIHRHPPTHKHIVVSLLCFEKRNPFSAILCKRCGIFPVQIPCIQTFQYCPISILSMGGKVSFLPPCGFQSRRRVYGVLKKFARNTDGNLSLLIYSSIDFFLVFMFCQELLRIFGGYTGGIYIDDNWDDQRIVGNYPAS